MTENTDKSPKDDASTDEGRREALGKMGKFVAYTAPALLALLVATKAQASSIVIG